MDDNNNSFLNAYKRKAANQSQDQQEAPAAKSESPSLRYEQKSKFVRSPRREGGGPPAGRRRTSLLVPIIVGVAAVACIVTGLILYFNRGVKVVDFTNWPINDAQLWASDNHVKLQVQEQYNDQTDAGKIVNQTPAKDQTVSRNGFIRVTVSLGHDLTVSLPLPDLKSMTNAEIEKWAADNFMTKVRITSEFSEEIEAGRVISFEVNDNTVVDDVRRNTPIYIIISKGREDVTDVPITVPNFREKTISECYVFANENGIVLEIIEQYDDFAPKGAILTQSVKADEKIKKGDTVTLTVSKGKKITVPSFAEYSKQKATAMASELGIPMSIVEQYSSKATGEFISQSIPADSVYNDGDVLELYYSLGNKVAVADFVGQTRDAIETWAKGLNDQGASIVIKVSQTQSNAPKGKILYQDKSDMMIGISTTIKITVSLGKAVFVPDFVAPAGSGYDVAITREEALAMCEALNIVPIFVQAKSSNRLPGEIWSQSIAAGTEVSEESTITLKYAPANVKVTVPNLVGKTVAAIRAGNYFKMLDITFVVADAYVDGYPNKAYKQSLRAGSKVASGSAITVYISPPAPPPEPTEEPTVEPATTP